LGGAGIKEKLLSGEKYLWAERSERKTFCFFISDG